MNQPLPPFSCTYSPNIPELLTQLNCTLAISTYQAGKIIFISPKDEEYLVQLPRSFNKAMGIALKDDLMGIATKDEIIILSNSPELGKSYPKQPGVYDSFFVPRVTYYTGQVDIHDLHFGNQGLWAINTSFSCLVQVDQNYSFLPKWKPPFIDAFVSEDRCHLNGLAMEYGEPKYVSALGTGNSPQSWRENITSGGMVMDIQNNHYILQNLPMPHAPRLYKGNLYLLLSATGEVVKADLESGKYDVIHKIKGFVRGMSIYNDYIFVGISKLRQNSSTFKHLDIANDAKESGVIILHLPTGAFIGEIKYKTSVDEIYDVVVLPDMIRPGILNTIDPTHKLALSIPDATFWADISVLEK